MVEQLECLPQALRPKLAPCLVKPGPLGCGRRERRRKVGGAGLGPPSASTALYKLLSSSTCVTTLLILAAAELLYMLYRIIYYIMLHYIISQGHSKLKGRTEFSVQVSRLLGQGPSNQTWPR